MAVEKEKVRTGVKRAQGALDGEISRLKTKSRINSIKRAFTFLNEPRKVKLTERNGNIAEEIKTYRADIERLENDNGKGMSVAGAKLALPQILAAKENARNTKNRAGRLKGVLKYNPIGVLAWGGNKVGKFFEKMAERVEIYAEKNQWSVAQSAAKNVKKGFNVINALANKTNSVNKTAKNALQERKEIYRESQLRAEVIIENLLGKIDTKSERDPSILGRKEAKLEDNTTNRAQKAQQKEDKKEQKADRKLYIAKSREAAVAANERKNALKEKKNELNKQKKQNEVDRNLSAEAYSKRAETRAKGEYLMGARPVLPKPDKSVVPKASPPPKEALSEPLPESSTLEKLKAGEEVPLPPTPEKKSKHVQRRDSTRSTATADTMEVTPPSSSQVASIDPDWKQKEGHATIGTPNVSPLPVPPRPVASPSGVIPPPVPARPVASPSGVTPPSGPPPSVDTDTKAPLTPVDVPAGQEATAVPNPYLRPVTSSPGVTPPSVPPKPIASPSGVPDTVEPERTAPLSRGGSVSSIGTDATVPLTPVDVPANREATAGPLKMPPGPLPKKRGPKEGKGFGAKMASKAVAAFARPDHIPNYSKMSLSTAARIPSPGSKGKGEIPLNMRPPERQPSRSRSSGPSM